MTNNSEQTNRCTLIKDISTNIWNEIISFHRAGVNTSEIYYTKKLLAEILTHSNNLNFSIWASEPGNEKNWGSDIDIYVERQTNHFELYAFQAKVLKLGNLYDDLNRISLGTYQWQKLENYKSLKKCHINYLFYNGVRNFTYTGRNKCSSPYNEEQLGLSYVSVKNVERITLSKSSWGFSDFHTAMSHPLSEIFCCLGNDNSKLQTYTYEDIIATLNDYQQLEFLEDIEQKIEKALENNESENDRDKDKDSKNNDRIEAERSADIILVVRNTSSTY